VIAVGVLAWKFVEAEHVIDDEPKLHAELQKLDAQEQIALPLSQPRRRHHRQQGELMTMKRHNRSQLGICKVGWTSRNKSRLQSRRSFFLDIPFYRTLKLWLSYRQPMTRQSLG